MTTIWRARPWFRNTVMAVLITGVAGGGMAATAGIQDLLNRIHADQHALAQGNPAPASLLPATGPAATPSTAPASGGQEPQEPQLAANVEPSGTPPGPAASARTAPGRNRPPSSAPASSRPSAVPAPSPARAAPQPAASQGTPAVAVTVAPTPSGDCLVGVQVLTVRACVP